MRGASPVRLVICLYEQAIEDLRRAVIALEKGDIEGRTRGINHALMVIGQLQGSLDMQRGGEVARNLNRFYNVARTSLAEAQLKQSERILERQVSELVLIYEAWLEVERATMAPVGQTSEAAPTARAVAQFEAPPTEWNA